MKFEEGTFFGVRAPMVNQMGLRPDTISEDGFASAILPFNPALGNVHGTVSGPAIMTLLDFTMAASVRAHEPLSYTVITVDLSVKFLAPASSDLYAECHCESRGRSLCFAVGAVFNEHGEKIALANGVFKLVPAKGNGG